MLSVDCLLNDLTCCRALGELAFWLSQLEQSSSQQQFTEFLSSMLASNSSTQRLMTALIVTEWATKQKVLRHYCPWRVYVFLS